MDINIAPLAETHICGLHQVLDIVAKEKKFLATARALPIEQTKKLILATLANGYPQFVALRNDEVVGWCDVIPKFQGSFFAHQGILGMGLLPEFRHQGIGRRLLDKTLNAAFDYGLTRIELAVWEPNTNAIALYKKFGFGIEGLQRHAIYVDGQYVNLVSMALLREPGPIS